MSKRTARAESVSPAAAQLLDDVRQVFKAPGQRLMPVRLQKQVGARSRREAQAFEFAG